MRPLLLFTLATILANPVYAGAPEQLRPAADKGSHCEKYIATGAATKQGFVGSFATVCGIQLLESPYVNVGGAGFLLPRLLQANGSVCQAYLAAAEEVEGRVSATIGKVCGDPKAIAQIHGPVAARFQALNHERIVTKGDLVISFENAAPKRAATAGAESCKSYISSAAVTKQDISLSFDEMCGVRTVTSRHVLVGGVGMLLSKVRRADGSICQTQLKTAEEGDGRVAASMEQVCGGAKSADLGDGPLVAHFQELNRKRTIGKDDLAIEFPSY